MERFGDVLDLPQPGHSIQHNKVCQSQPLSLRQMVYRDAGERQQPYEEPPYPRPTQGHEICAVDPLALGLTLGRSPTLPSVVKEE